MPDLLETGDQLVGLLLVLVIFFLWAGGPVRHLIKAATDGIPDRKSPTDTDQKIWDDLISLPHSKEAGKWIGALERSLFILAIWFSEPVIILGWLAFKAASKWDAWQNITQVSTNLDGVDNNVRFLEWRRRWSSHVFMRSAIGTVLNLFAAGLAVALGRLINQVLGTL